VAAVTVETMAETHVEELVTEPEWEAAYPVMMQLWDDTPRELARGSYLELLHELRDVEGYRLFGLFADGTLVALAGISIRMSTWYGRYCWVYDLVTDREHRSNGYGERLLSFLKRWATEQGCETIALASALDRDDAHRFYEDADMERSSYVFKQRLG